MVLVQLRLATAYRRLSFSVGFWAFTFSYAAAATFALRWIAATRPPGATVMSVTVLVLITGFVAAIAIRSVAALRLGTLVPRPDLTM
jgi:tellurite resistance protein